ncbi:MAG: TolC family protein [Elusimicrobiota bacterium]
MKHIIYAFIISAAISLPCFAETGGTPLTLGRCISLAQKESEGLAIQRERQDQAAQRVKQARGGMLPNLKFKYQKTYRDTVDGAYTTDLNDSKIALSQPLFSGFSKKSSLDFSKNEVQKESLNYESSARDLKADVTWTFYSVAQIDGDIANIKNTRQLMEERRSELLERVRLGKSRNSEILVLESQIATLSAQEEKARADRAIAVETLAYLIGSDPAGLAVADDTPAPGPAEPLEKYLESAKNRSDIEAEKRNVLSQQYKVAVARGSLLPTLNLDGSWYTQRSGSMSDSKWDAVFSLDVPLFQGGTARGKTDEELSRLREYEAGLSRITREVDTEIRKLYRSAVSSVNQASAYSDAFDKSGKSYQMQVNDYRFGLVNNLDIIQFMIVMLDTKKNLDRALIQSKLDRALLEIEAGR